MKKPPCKDCTDRSPGCSGNCCKYKKWHTEQVMPVQRGQSADKEYGHYVVRQINKIKKERN